MSTYLPEEIISLILSRLPVKPLISFKCVSKSWYNLIDNPTFISMHLGQSIIQDDNKKEIESFLVIHSDKTIRKHVVNLLSQETYDFVYLNIPYKNYARITFLGSCNGLVCVGARTYPHAVSEYFVINPATRESRGIYHTVDNTSLYCSFGFGFDPIKKDYKLVRVERFTDNAGQRCSRAEVWTLSTGTWRQVDGVVEGELRECSCKAVLNGAFHWVADRKSVGMGYPISLIVSFHVSNEVFGEITGPNFDYGIHSCQLSVCKGSLSIFVAYDDDIDERIYPCFDVWVMNEYGVKESWTKLFTVKVPNIMMPLGFGKNGEMLVVLMNGDFGLYDPCTRGTKALPIKVQHGALSVLSNYVESLVSVRTGNEFEERFAVGHAI